MRGRHWKVLAFAMVIGVGVPACGGDEAGDDTLGEEPLETQQPQQQTGQTQGQADVPANLPEGVTPELYAQGKQLFTGQGICQTCHGPDATGTQLAPDLTDDEWLNISGRNMEEIVQLIHEGVPQPVEHPAPMPPLGGASLTDEQVQALAAYVASLGQG